MPFSKERFMVSKEMQPYYDEGPYVRMGLTEIDRSWEGKKLDWAYHTDLLVRQGGHRFLLQEEGHGHEKLSFHTFTVTCHQIGTKPGRGKFWDSLAHIFTCGYDNPTRTGLSEFVAVDFMAFRQFIIEKEVHFKTKNRKPIHEWVKVNFESNVYFLAVPIYVLLKDRVAKSLDVVIHRECDEFGEHYLKYRTSLHRKRKKLSK
jgi:hypothetical protein